jgi:V8-like Glu-specific endopeptidase
MRRALTILLALTLGGVLAAPAVGAPKRNPKKAAEVSAYWTAERMKNAKPRERARPGGGGGGGGKAADWSRTTVPAPYTGTNAMNGKVFMTIGGVDYVCSGTAVSASADVNLVWTAGHCVTDGPDAEATNFAFVPAYNGSSAVREPYGRWIATSPADIESTPGWTGQGRDKFRYDVGAARVEKDGAPTATFTGSLGGTRSIAFGQNPDGIRIASYGYPAAGKFNGQIQYVCSSPFRRWDTATSLDPMQISCDMTGGSSGGGWIRDTNNVATDGDGGGPLISVNSYGYQFEKNTMYGPFMKTGDDNQAEDLYNTMRLAG